MGCPGGVQGVSSPAPALLARACSPRAPSRGCSTVCGHFGGKWDECVGVKGALGQSDICDRLCIFVLFLPYLKGQARCMRRSWGFGDHISCFKSSLMNGQLLTNVILHMETIFHQLTSVVNVMFLLLKISASWAPLKWLRCST